MLAKELRQFLSENEQVSPRELKTLWLKLGAQGWQADLSIRDTLEEFNRALERALLVQ